LAGQPRHRAPLPRGSGHKPIAGLGYYRGWFQVSTEGSDHQSDMTISVDRDKIRGDEDKVKKSVHLHPTKSTEKLTDETPSSERRHDEP
jgi:hypothetical protein